MAANSSFSSPWSISSELNLCFKTTAGALNTKIFTVVCLVFFLPLYVLILRLGFQRWRTQPSRPMSHSDIFTYHMVVIEIMCICGTLLTCVGTSIDVPFALPVGYFLLFSNTMGQLLFHVLTCLERYLAIVHPITYLNLKSANGIRARNVVVALSWLTSFIAPFVTHMESRRNYAILSLAALLLVFITITFYSVSVLWVLTRPGPGDGAGSRQFVQQSKMRPFYTIMAILAALSIRIEGTIVIIVLTVLKTPNDLERCGPMLLVPWLCPPSSLVLPLLFLQRAGKLQCCRNRSVQNQRAGP